MEFAQAAAGLPQDDAWRRAVVPVIELQAVTYALAELNTLPTAERPVAMDRAEVLIARNERAMEDIWGGSERPTGVMDLLIDARMALVAARLATGSGQN